MNNKTRGLPRDRRKLTKLLLEPVDLRSWKQMAQTSSNSSNFSTVSRVAILWTAVRRRVNIFQPTRASHHRLKYACSPTSKARMAPPLSNTRINAELHSRKRPTRNSTMRPANLQNEHIRLTSLDKSNREIKWELPDAIDMIIKFIPKLAKFGIG